MAAAKGNRNAYKHGNTSKGKLTKLYMVWVQMRNRCNNPNHEAYKNYGGRGITVYPAWDNFEVFAAYVGQPSGSNLTLERIDNSLGYEPGNVRWATYKDQARNRRTNKIDLQSAQDIRAIYATGGITQKMLAAKYGLSKGTINLIIHNKIWA